MAKYKVKVTLRAETEVVIDVEVSDAEPDGDPTDLTEDEEQEAIDAAVLSAETAEWEVVSVELA